MFEHVELQPSELMELHDRSSGNREDLIPGTTGHCFHCLAGFDVSEIKEWIPEVVRSGETALCPKCGIDSVLSLKSLGLVSRFTGFQVLLGMKSYWFDRDIISGFDRVLGLDVGMMQREAYHNSCRKGFWDIEPGVQVNIPEKLMLVVREVSEALEEHRNGSVDRREFHYVKDGKPEGFGIELADVIIRVADLAGHLNIDLAEMCLVKMKYNKTRPKKHGKLY